MKRGPIFAAVLFVVLCVLASFAAAQGTAVVPSPVPSVPVEAEKSVPYDWKTHGVFVVGKIGAYGPTDDESNDYEVYNPQSGYDLGVALGYRFNPYSTLQLELDYQNYTGEFAGWEVNALPIVAVAHLGIPVDDFEVYILGGIGALFYTVDSPSDEGIDEVAVLGKLGGGINFHLEHWFIGGEVGYQMTNAEFVPNDGIIGVVTVGYSY